MDYNGSPSHMNVLRENIKDLIVFTDLDGTLLDHDTYSFDEAMPALNRLRKLGIPVIPTTSKTFAELEVLLQELDMMSPVIVENGGVIAIPISNDSPTSPQQHRIGDFNLSHTTVDYTSIIEVLKNIRAKYHLKFRGFNDMDVAEISEITGLNFEKAENAKKRLCSEPLIWVDSDKNLNKFENELKRYHLSMTQGGRFWHVMGEASKSKAMKEVVEIYQRKLGENLTVIALGDNANDISMLKSADIGVVIRRKDQSCLSFESGNKIYTSSLSGPAGWNAFFMHFLDNYPTS